MLSTCNIVWQLVCLRILGFHEGSIPSSTALDNWIHEYNEQSSSAWQTQKVKRVCWLRMVVHYLTLLKWSECIIVGFSVCVCVCACVCILKTFSPAFPFSFPPTSLLTPSSLLSHHPRAPPTSPPPTSRLAGGGGLATFDSLKTFRNLLPLNIAALRKLTQ